MATKFQQRHYEAVAGLIKNRLEDINKNQKEVAIKVTAVDQIANDFAMMFRLDNPNFKPERFFKACGISA